MEISIVTINRVFKSYQGQARIAELNNRNPVKRIQGQRDRVSISDGARAALKAHGAGQSPVRTEGSPARASSACGNSRVYAG